MKNSRTPELRRQRRQRAAVGKIIPVFGGEIAFNARREVVFRRLAFDLQFREGLGDQVNAKSRDTALA